MTVIAREPAISVVIPTFQRREQVLRAIDSALAQTLLPAEVLVVDDGSTDGTGDAVTGRFGDGVRLLRQPNRGPSAARNVAIRVARGDVIAFLDSDDRWLPHHLAVVADLLARHPTAVLVGTQRDYESGDERASDAQLRDFAEDLLLTRVGVGIPVSVAVRREALEAAGLFDEQLRYGEDCELFLRLALVGAFCLISATTVERGRSPDSLEDEGRRIGAYLGFLERSADSVLAALDRCQRGDTDALRAAARARRAIGVVLASLARGEQAETVRHQLAQIRRWAPGVDEARILLWAAHWIVPGWDQPEQRQRVATTLLEATRPTLLSSSAGRPSDSSGKGGLQ